ncbi:4-phosphopantetheinyl transferase family protein [Flavobacterium sp. ZT3R18]|uniref:4'-phosphopantetheinyl transferase family protein n=1 Tax=Flavobacterium sp. ZT3R18 TaxID=2594429 RepID=UPI00117AF487|nr:4'-phosphopantetheinyl transferase superfamily protein [Flavobacterium sp. ZT3R18]TRX35732.1 4-phosphopantetheinyl transferase family protein [Flavobacterium sp. ZT3R18]
MIGNDIVDLDLALKESNWKRNRFLDKIFSSKEQQLILNSENQDLMVWNLWSRKEASYKIYNRQTGIRGFFPLRLECDYKDKNIGTVSIDGFVFYTQTEITTNFIYSVAVFEKRYFKKIKTLDTTTIIKKENGVPYLLDPISNSKIPVSITHHGRFQRIISV